MDNKNSISNSPNKGTTPARFRQKDWVKKLEAASGKQIESRKFNRIVYLIVDCSGSMTEGNKIDQAKIGAMGFAREAQRKEYSVGLIQFASYAEHILEPQKEFSGFNANVERLSAGGSTNMSAAIHMAIDNLFGKAGEKVICIVTDGMPDDKKATLDAAHDARKQAIEIMTIGTDDADKDFLEELATRKVLSLKVSRDRLERGIVSMAKMLPG